jgi:hypothetical protein
VVICVDNSASIAPSEQAIVRETLMLLGDLAAVGDRLTIVAFGDAVRVWPAVEIAADAEREHFKALVRTALDFRGRKSDIRAAIRALDTPGIFRAPGRSLRVPVVISDGKLEPASGSVQEALDETRAVMRGNLASTGIYAIVTGTTGAHQQIVPGLTGLEFMEREVALTPARMFHAASLDQLLDAVVLVLRKAKGISSLGEEDRAEFKVDDTVDEFAVIVRKRGLSGEVLCRGDQIRIEHRAGPNEGATELTLANHSSAMPGVYWTDDYEHFDLVVVRRPRVGIWRVTLASGGPPQVITKIDTPLELRVDARPLYFVNESAAMTATIFDRRNGTLSTKPYRLDLYLPSAGIYRPFAAAGNGTYVLEVPSAFATSNQRGPVVGVVDYEVVAQQRLSEGKPDLDPWFVRRSVKVPVEIVEPIVRWQELPPRRFALLGDVDVPVTLRLEAGSPHSPAFETPPRAEIAVERWNDETRARRQQGRIALEASTSATGTSYRGTLRLREAGTYRVAFSVQGSTRQGPFVMTSPLVTLDVVSLRILVWIGAAALIAGVLAWLSRYTVRLRGRLEVLGARGRRADVTLPTARVFVASRDLGGVDITGTRFELRAVRPMFLRPRVLLTVKEGRVTVAELTKAGATRNVQVRTGHRKRLVRGRRYQFRFAAVGGEVTVLADIRR